MGCVHTTCGYDWGLAGRDVEKEITHPIHLRAYMSALFRCLEIECFILVIIVVCDENLKKIYWGETYTECIEREVKFFWPSLGFRSLTFQV